MRRRSLQVPFALIFVLPGLAGGQVSHPKQPEVFAKQFVEAINSKSTDRRRALLHSKTLACINTRTQPYFDWIFSRQLKYSIPSNYRTAATRYPENQAPEPGVPGDRANYPLPPTHRLQIDFETGPYNSMSIVLSIVYDGSAWREVLPCPSPETVAGAARAEAERLKQEQRARSLVTQLSEPRRSEVLALAKSRRRVDAIKKYAAASGEDLAIARRVVELLATRD